MKATKMRKIIILQGTLGWVWIVWSNVASKIWRKKEEKCYLPDLNLRTNKPARLSCDWQTDRLTCSGLSVVGDEQNKQTNKNNLGRAKDKRVKTKALSLPFLALVLPHCFSRSSFFFARHHTTESLEQATDRQTETTLIAAQIDQPVLQSV